MPSRRIRSNTRQYLLRLDRILQDELTVYVRSVAHEQKAYYRDVVGGWSRKPQFRTISEISNEVIRFKVEPHGDHKNLWIWLNRGTGLHGPKKRAYKIRPKTAPALRFQTGYSAKTAPGAQYDVGDGSKSGAWVQKQEVTHPGIKPRGFVDDSTKNLGRTFRRNVENIIRRSARRARS